MSERQFRLIQGLYIFLALYFELDVLILAFMAVIAMEGLTNWRIPIVVSRLRYGKQAAATAGPAGVAPVVQSETGKFEAERVLRLVIFVMLILTVLVFPEPGWFFPWFIGAMLFMAGLTNICPMVLLFRYLGFR